MGKIHIYKYTSNSTDGAVAQIPLDSMPVSGMERTRRTTDAQHPASTTAYGFYNGKGDLPPCLCGFRVSSLFQTTRLVLLLVFLYFAVHAGRHIRASCCGFVLLLAEV
jgi:hypothetical protein